MNPWCWSAALAVTVSLSGCLEVQQYPAYANGAYAGKSDNLVAQASFKGDAAAWKKAIDERNRGQNEFNRANP